MISKVLITLKKNNSERNPLYLNIDVSKIEAVEEVHNDYDSRSQQSSVKIHTATKEYVVYETYDEVMKKILKANQMLIEQY